MDGDHRIECSRSDCGCKTAITIEYKPHIWTVSHRELSRFRYGDTDSSRRFSGLRDATARLTEIAIGLFNESGGGRDLPNRKLDGCVYCDFKNDENPLSRIPATNASRSEPDGYCSYGIARYVVRANARHHMSDRVLTAEGVQKPRKTYRRRNFLPFRPHAGFEIGITTFIS